MEFCFSRIAFEQKLVLPKNHQRFSPLQMTVSRVSLTFR